MKNLARRWKLWRLRSDHEAVTHFIIHHFGRFPICGKLLAKEDARYATALKALNP